MIISRHFFHYIFTFCLIVCASLSVSTSVWGVCLRETHLLPAQSVSSVAPASVADSLVAAPMADSQLQASAADTLPQPVAPVLTRALRDSLAEHTRMAHRLSTDARNPDFKAARRHVEQLLYLADSLGCPMATYLVTAGDVEDLAFNYERNKPALGKKTDEKECLAAAKRCYLYYRSAYELYGETPAPYGKEMRKTLKRIQPVAMQYYLLTKGFLVNAGQSFARNDLEATLEEFRMSYDGSTRPFLLTQYEADRKRSAGFETFMADSTRSRTLYNCGTVSMALRRYSEALAYFDTLKVHGYDVDKVYRNTVAIYHAQNDTVSMMRELSEAMRLMPQSTWFKKNLLQLQIDRQEWAEAHQLAAEITAIDSLDAQTMCMQGQLYEHLGYTYQAMDIYQRSYAIDSTQANVCSFIGRICYNRALKVKEQLFNQRKTALSVMKLTPLYNQAQPWYERAYALDTERRDHTIAQALREMLYFRFTQADCPNSQELIEFYNEVSRAYGMQTLGE